MKKLVVLLVLLAGLWQGAAAQVGSLFCDTLWSSKLPISAGGCYYARFYSDELKIVTGTGTGMLYILEANKGIIVDSMPSILPRSGSNPLSFFDYAFINGKNLVCFPSADSIAIMNLDTKRIEKVFKDTILSRQNYGITAFKGVFNQNKNQIAIEFFNEKSTSDRSQDSFVVYFYDVSTYELLSVKTLGSAGYNVMEYSPDGSLFVGNSYVNRKPPIWPQGKYVCNTFDVYATDKLTKLYSMQFDSSKYISDICLTLDNKLLVASNNSGDIDGQAYSDEFIRIYDLTNQTLKQKLTTRTSEILYHVYKPTITNDSKKILAPVFSVDDKYRNLNHLILFDIIQNKTYFISDSLMNNILPPAISQLNKSNSKLLGSPYIYLLDISNILSITLPSPEKNILYPNPLTNEITITGLENEKLIENISIYDFSGKAVKNVSSSDIRIDNNSISFNCSDLPVGSYLLRLNYLTDSRTFKIIKEK